MEFKPKNRCTGILPEISRAMNGNCKSFSINLKQKMSKKNGTIS
jgi:hypothetical protein